MSTFCGRCKNWLAHRIPSDTVGVKIKACFNKRELKQWVCCLDYVGLKWYVTMSQRPLNNCVFEISWILSSVQMIVFKLLQDELWIENNKEWHLLLGGGGCVSQSLLHFCRSCHSIILGTHWY